MKHRIFYAILAIGLLSCEKNSVYKQFDSDFENNRWQRSDVRDHAFEITAKGPYDLLIDFSYVADVQFAEIPVDLILTDPNGQTTLQRLTLITKDSDAKEVGDCAGDLCDLRQAVLNAVTLAPGKYKVRLENRFNHEYLPNVIGIGIRVQRSE